MQKNMSSLLLRCFLLVACLSLITGNAHALTVNCPASPAGLISIVGVLLHSPAVPAVQSITPKSSVSGDTMLCSYTVQVTQNYSTPTFLPSCPSYPLVLALTTAATAPFSAATAWAFGAPGTPMGSSYAISASQQINAAYSRIPISSPPLHGYIGNCKVVNNGVFTYAIYSNFSDGYTCSTSGRVPLPALHHHRRPAQNPSRAARFPPTIGAPLPARPVTMLQTPPSSMSATARWSMALSPTQP